MSWALFAVGVVVGCMVLAWIQTGGCHSHLRRHRFDPCDKGLLVGSISYRLCLRCGRRVPLGTNSVGPR